MSTSTRREFMKSAGSAAAALSISSALPTSLAAQPAAKRRYAIIGTGSRGTSMWGRALIQRYPDVLEFVGLCDSNSKRVAIAKETMKLSCPTFTSFDAMCDAVKPELLCVTTVDAFHSDYIVRALDRGIDVITEKPMVIDEQQCQAVLDAEKRNNRKIVVGFNYRFAPKHVKIKEILMSGELGPVLSVDFSWYLDVQHGADYFRRWHRLKNKGGSLWVHKASHHFDLINWWLGADPVEVQATGALSKYGKSGPFRHTHCRPCPHKSQCEFHWDITKMRGAALYTQAESEDQYYRDGCVFREDCDIYDSMTATVKYSNGALMAYSLNAHMPIEGYRLAFNCAKGRLEVRDFERQSWETPEETEMFVMKSFGQRTKIDIPKATGGHGGGDDHLRDQIFRRTQAPDHLKLPDSRAGAMSCLTGIAARKSIEERRPIKVADLIKLT